MNRLYVAIGLIVLTLVICTTGVLMIGYYKNKYTEELETAYTEFKNENYDKVFELIDSFEKQWEKSERKLLVFVNHNELDEISRISSALKYYLIYKDYPMFSSELYKIIGIMEHIFKSEVPNIWSVF